MENLEFREKEWIGEYCEVYKVKELENNHLKNICNWINYRGDQFELDFDNNEIGLLEWIEIFNKEIN